MNFFRKNRKSSPDVPTLLESLGTRAAELAERAAAEDAAAAAAAAPSGGDDSSLAAPSSDQSALRRSSTPAAAIAAATAGAGGSAESEPDPVLEELRATLSSIRFTMYGDQEVEPDAEKVQAIHDALLASPALVQLVENMTLLPFEARKDLRKIFNHLMRHANPAQRAVDFVAGQPRLTHMLVEHTKNTLVALNCGAMLREILKHEQLCQMVYDTPHLWHPYFRFMQDKNFEVASDAFDTFKILLTRHPPLAATFLQNNFEEFFQRYNELLQSRNFVTKKQALKFLGELLTKRTNFRSMMRYINDPANLTIFMQLLRRGSKAIQLETFHVFKIFVANPRKAEPIVIILHSNRDAILEFLEKLSQRRQNDERLAKDIGVLRSKLEQLPAPKLDDDQDEADEQPSG